MTTPHYLRTHENEKLFKMTLSKIQPYVLDSESNPETQTGEAELVERQRQHQEVSE